MLTGTNKFTSDPVSVETSLSVENKLREMPHEDVQSISAVQIQAKKMKLND